MIDDLHELDSRTRSAGWRRCSRAAAAAAGSARDARGADARPASASGSGRADRSARTRPALLARRDARRARAKRITLSDASLTSLHERTEDGRPGAAPGRHLARGSPGPGALRIRVLRQRADRGGLPLTEVLEAPAARGARPAAAHVAPRARQRPAGRCAHRRRGSRGDPPAARRPERLRHRARRRPHLVPLPPPVRRSVAPRIAPPLARDDPALHRAAAACTNRTATSSRRPPLSSSR